MVKCFLYKKNNSKKYEVNSIKNERMEYSMKVLLIVPAYNEALNIEKTIKDITENTDYDYVIINDCSKDNTKEVCEKNGFNMLSLPINYGLTSGIQLGMKYAKKYDYDIAIQFDGDGQHQAKYVKNLVEEIEKGNCNIAIGSRFVTEKKTKKYENAWKYVTFRSNKANNWKNNKRPYFWNEGL